MHFAHSETFQGFDAVWAKPEYKDDLLVLAVSARLIDPERLLYLFLSKGCPF